MSLENSPWMTAPLDSITDERPDSAAGMTHAQMLGSPGLHTSLAQFARATGLTVVLYDNAGTIHGGPFTATPLGARLAAVGCWEPNSQTCLALDRDAVQICIDTGGVVHRQGLGTLSFFAIPVRLTGRTIGAVVAGWVFDNFPDPISTDRLATAIDVSFPELWGIARQQPPVSPEKLGIYAELLQTLCDLFMRERAETLREQEQSRSLRALYQSAQQLAAATSVETIGAATVEAVVALLNPQSVRLMVVDEDGVWRVAAGRGFDEVLSHGQLASYPRTIMSTLRIPVEAVDGSLLAIIETTDNEAFTDNRRRTQIAALAAQTAVALQKSRLIEDLQHERESLRRANRVKDEFLATLSHELRTPLTPILSWVTILNETPPEEEELFATGLEAIDRNAKQELHLVEEMLDLTRILNDKVVLDLALIHPRDILGPVFDLAQSMAAPRSLRLQLETAQDLPAISADPKRLHQILSNLISNAVKFTPDGGSITLGVTQNDSMVEFFVEDSGIGIEPDHISFIFDRFRQADSSSTRRHGGLGIGLSVVRGLVELHGGTVRASSDGPGRGSRFVVSLPASRAHAHDIEPLPRQPEINGQITERLREGRVLIVDDAIDTLVSIKMLVERTGYRVETATSAMAALAAAHSFDPDVIVSDLGMPEQDGFDLIRMIHNDSVLASKPVIALTGFATMHDREAALAAGFAAHIPKPVEFPVLLAVIDRLITQSSFE